MMYELLTVELGILQVLKEKQAAAALKIQVSNSCFLHLFFPS